MLKLKIIKKKKIFSVLFISIFVFLSIMPFFGVKAQEKEIPINIRIPVLTNPCESLKSDGSLMYPNQHCVSGFGEYINNFYKWFARAAGIFAVVMIVYGGFQWIFAQGNATKIEKAKATINGALVGLVLTLGATLLLQTINPNLITFRSLYLTPITSRYLTAEKFCPKNADGSFNLTALEAYKEYESEGKILTEKDLTCNRVFHIEGSSDNCLGHYCIDATKTCSYNINSEQYICQSEEDLKDICERVKDPESQADCDAAVGNVQFFSDYICRLKEDDCEWKKLINSENPPCGDDHIWAPCEECLKDDVNSDGSYLLLNYVFEVDFPPNFCDINTVDERVATIGEKGGVCVDPGGYPASAIDAICCKTKTPNSGGEYEYFCRYRLFSIMRD